MKPNLLLPSSCLIMVLCSGLNAQSYDSCASALLISVPQACDADTFNNLGATAEPVSVAPNPTCGFYQGADVWFKAVMPVSGALRLELSSIWGINPQCAVYKGYCGSLTQITCIQLDNNRTVIDTTLAGDTLYIRVFNYNSTSGGVFTLCVWEPDVPLNNNCDQAIMLNVSNACSPDTFSNAYATSQPMSIAPNPTCGFYRGGDVWFKFILPKTGKASIHRTNLSGYTAQFSVYSGICGNFIQIACAQLINILNIDNYSLANDTLYLRIFSYNSEEGGPFNLCVYDASCNNMVTQHDYDTISCGDNYNFPDGTSMTGISSSMTHINVFTASNHCDSLIITHLHVSPQITMISGNLLYLNQNGTPLSNDRIILKNLSGLELDSSITASDGSFQFDFLQAGYYSLAPRILQPYGGINSSDALRILQHISWINRLTGLPEKVADVNKSNHVTSADALLVSKRTVGLINCFTSGDWLCDTLGFLLDCDNTNQTIHALCYGDVNASYIPGNLKAEPFVSLISNDQIYCNSGDEIEIPIISAHDIRTSAITLSLSFPTHLLEITETRSILPDYVYNVENENFRFGWYNLKPFILKSGEPFIILSAKVKMQHVSDIIFSLVSTSEFADVSAIPIKGVQLEVPVINITNNIPYQDILKLYPNPADNEVKISIISGHMQQLSIVVTDIIGNLISNRQIPHNSINPTEEIIYTGDFPNGIYFIQMFTGNESGIYLYREKLLILH